MNSNKGGFNMDDRFRNEDSVFNKQNSVQPQNIKPTVLGDFSEW